jgi:membrane protease YdiL (CAAX protease family)
MNTDQLTPTQWMQLMTLGLILITTFAVSIGAWAWFVYRSAHKVPFQTAIRPLATIGLLDCLIGLLLFSGFILLASRVWRIVHANPAASVTMNADSGTSPKTEQLSEADGTAPDENAPADNIDSADRIEAADGTATADGQAAKTGTKGAKPETKTLTADQFIFSGWVSVGQLLAAIATGLYVIARTRAGPRAIGCETGHFARDIGIGLWVLFLVFPILLIASGLINAASGIEYSHPIIDIMKSYPWLIGLVAWQAVIVAPITEEFFFRTLLIGWLESVHYGLNPKAIWQGWQPLTSSSNSAREESSSPIDSVNPYHTSVSESSRAMEPTGGRFVPPWWPAIVSGALFGIAHFSYGVSWLPLIVFGIVLGRVYQLRQSLWMCIAIHMVFNAINLFNLWLSLGLPRPGQ